MVDAILFHFCDGCFITLMFAPRRLPRCNFPQAMLGDRQN